MERCCIIYGTETGCTENAAYSTYFQLYTGGVPVDISVANLISPSVIFDYSYVIFFVSTSAYGEFPHNFQSLIEFLLDLKDELSSLKYTIFGLGDSRYPLYNYAARKLHYIFKKLNGIEFLRVAFGDDQHPLGCDGELIVWRGELKNYFNVSSFKLPQLPLNVMNVANPSSTPYKSRFNVGEVTFNKIITSERHFTTVKSIGIRGRFNTGDVCCVIPVDENVNELLEKLGINEESGIVITRSPSSFDTITSIYMKGQSNSRGIPLGKSTSVATLFKFYLCLRNICSQFQMYILSLYTDDELHKNKLLEMSADTVEGCMEYYRYCKRERRSLYDVLYDFPTVKLPLDVLINIATPYYPRMYSIASHRYSTIPPPLYNKYPMAMNYNIFKKFINGYKKRDEIELCIVDVKYSTPSRKVDGACFKYLSDKRVGDKVEYFIYKTPFSSILLNIGLPVMFVCTGTGIAACKPFIEARIHNFSNLWNDLKRIPPIKDLAFLGFRRPDQDNLYPYNPLIELWCRMVYAHSRTKDRKYYVQDAIQEHSKEVSSLGTEESISLLYPLYSSLQVHEILMSGLVLISGKSHPMPSSVLEALKSILKLESGFSDSSARRFIESSFNERRIIIDTWG